MKFKAFRPRTPNIFCFVLTAFVAGSCNSPGAKHFDSGPETTRSLALIDEAQASVPAADRTEADLSYDKVIRRVLTNNELEEHFILKHDQIEGLYIDSEYYLREYDKLLDDSVAKKQSGDTFKKRSYSTGIYPHLLALHFLIDQIQDQLTYELGRFLEIEEKSNDAQTKNRIHGAVKDLINYLQYVPYSTILALNPWMEDFAALHPKLTDWQHAYRHLAVGNPDQIFKLQQDPKVKSHLEYMLSKYARKPGYMTDRVDDLARTFAAYTKDVGEGDKGGRVPASFVPQRFALLFGGGDNLSFAKQTAVMLTEKNLKGVFAVSGIGLARNPDDFNSVKAAGMTFANFTFSHPELPRLEDDSLAYEVTATQNMLAHALGDGPTWLLPPYGAGYTSPRVQAVAAQSDLKNLFWTIDALDWIDRQPEAIVSRVQKEIRLDKQGVILFHLNHQESVKAVSAFLNSANHFQFIVPGDH